MRAQAKRLADNDGHGRIHVNGRAHPPAAARKFADALCIAGRDVSVTLATSPPACTTMRSLAPTYTRFKTTFWRSDGAGKNGDGAALEVSCWTFSAPVPHPA